MTTRDEILHSVNELKQSFTTLAQNIAEERSATQRRLERIESEIAKIAGGLAVVLSHDKSYQLALDDHKKKLTLSRNIWKK